MSEVNYILHHKNAFIKIVDDPEITTIDIAIYNALFMLWNNCGFAKELSINRNDIMRLSKVGNANTYTNSLKRLHKKKFIIYKPSHSPLIGSKVTMCIFGASSVTSGDISGGSTGATLYKHSKHNKHNKQEPTVNGSDIIIDVPDKPKDKKIVDDIDFDKLIEFINLKTKRNFKVIDDNLKRKYKKLLKDRNKEDLFNAIINASKNQWHIEKKYQYLTPEFFSRPVMIDKWSSISTVENKKIDGVDIIPMNFTS